MLVYLATYLHNYVIHLISFGLYNSIVVFIADKEQLMNTILMTLHLCSICVWMVFIWLGFN